MTDPEQPGDPVLRAVADYWDDIQGHADPGQRRLDDGGLDWLNLRLAQPRTKVRR